MCCNCGTSASFSTDWTMHNLDSFLHSFALCVLFSVSQLEYPPICRGTGPEAPPTSRAWTAGTRAACSQGRQPPEPPPPRSAPGSVAPAPASGTLYRGISDDGAPLGPRDAVPGFHQPSLVSAMPRSSMWRERLPTTECRCTQAAALELQASAQPACCQPSAPSPAA